MEELRRCTVSGTGKEREKVKPASFHKWVDIAFTIGEPVTFGAPAAGQVKHTLGLIEYDDGTVRQVDPSRIKFIV